MQQMGDHGKTDPLNGNSQKYVAVQRFSVIVKSISRSTVCSYPYIIDHLWSLFSNRYLL